MKAWKITYKQIDETYFKKIEKGTDFLLQVYKKTQRIPEELKKKIKINDLEDGSFSKVVIIKREIIKEDEKKRSKKNKIIFWRITRKVTTLVCFWYLLHRMLGGILQSS